MVSSTFRAGDGNTRCTSSSSSFTISAFFAQLWTHRLTSHLIRESCFKSPVPLILVLRLILLAPRRKISLLPFAPQRTCFLVF